MLDAMNLRDLHYVVAVAEHGHFGRAATACNVSQPTLSGQILKLEEELGVQIFERSGHMVRLTAKGETILDHARKIVAAANDLVDAARSLRDPFAGEIRLGIISTLGPYLSTHFLSAAAQSLPRAPLVLIEDLTDRLLGLLLDGKLDAALVATEQNIERLDAIDLFDEPFWLVAPRDHKLARFEKVAVQDIEPKSLLLLTEGHCLRDQALELCGRPGVGGETRADMRATSLETLLHLTVAGYGVTLVPSLAVDRSRALFDRLAARPLAGAGVSRRVRLVFRRETPRRPALSALAEAIRDGLPDCVQRVG
jgi:LysR family transcriptional regulator, hydrogen peroxide-inducible genes activator